MGLQGRVRSDGFGALGFSGRDGVLGGEWLKKGEWKAEGGMRWWGACFFPRGLTIRNGAGPIGS